MKIQHRVENVSDSVRFAARPGSLGALLAEQNGLYTKLIKSYPGGAQSPVQLLKIGSYQESRSLQLVTIGGLILQQQK